MKSTMHRVIKMRFFFMIAWAFSQVGTLLAEEVDFSREVLPILSDRCFHCHGPDASHRKGKLRLDLEEEAKKDRKGYQVVAEDGKPDSSELWYHITTDDEDDLMPPADSHRKPLSEKERDVVKRWLEQGAKWGEHWAFEKPVRPEVPKGADHPVDAFVRARLKEEGWEPAPRADRHTLRRRVSFDLTGLPPTKEALAEESSWEEFVDQLLGSKHHGERMAMWWLDAARYSDTDGYQQDQNRTNWPWRDWVVDAFNANMPFDQFTREQFAGDLLPDATPEQVLATCFHRNHMTNGEGGRIAEQSRIDYVIDRVNTTGTVWLGLTLGCVQCHDHKFDPVSQQDYYQLFAFFDSIDESGGAGTKAKPYLKYKSKYTAESIAQAEKHLAEVREEYGVERTASEERFKVWLEKTREGLSPDFQAWRTPKPREVETVVSTELQVEEGNIVQAHGEVPRQDDYWIRYDRPEGLERLAGWKLEVFPHESHKEGKFSLAGNGEFILTKVKVLVTREGETQVRDLEMARAVADFQGKNDTYKSAGGTIEDDPRKGWTTVGAKEVTAHTVVYELREPLDLLPDDEISVFLEHRSTDGFDSIGRFRISFTDQRGDAVKKLAQAPMEVLAKLGKEEKVPGGLYGQLRGQYLLDDAVFDEVLQRVNAATRQVNEFKKAAGDLQMQVLGEREKPRTTYILERGVWDAKGEAVKAGVIPAVLPKPAEETTNRLELAEWITSADNPLTARVTVNHLWQLLFGSGLVRTTEDFGLQGELPTHPDLMDWLAIELVESGWDLRHVLRIIATSETYRQSSHASSAMLEEDPENRLLARAPRYRLPAWMIRDAALVSSGLLNPTIGGPPVKPWQPPGVWSEIFMGRYKHEPSVGPAQYRRTLYAFWRRASAPTFLFDSAQRRVCEVGVRRTNTPLQALTLLNDRTMLEASRVLGQEETEVKGIAMRVLGRVLDKDEQAVIDREFRKALKYYEEEPEAAKNLTRIGQQKAADQEAAPAIAARMTVASLILNLDEAMTRE